MSLRFRVVPLAAALTGLAAAASVIQPQLAQASGVVASGVNFADFNLCGVACLGGGPPTSAVETQIGTWKPSAMTVEEACLTQAQQLESQVTSGGVQWFNGMAFAFKKTDSSCPNDGNGQQFGNAILTHHAITAGSWHTTDAITPSANAQQIDAQQGLTPSGADSAGCGQTYAVSGSTNVYYEVCVTHLAPRAWEAESEVTSLTNFVLTYGGGEPMFLGGDFNMNVNDHGEQDVGESPPSIGLDAINHICHDGTIGCGRFQEMYGINTDGPPEAICKTAVDARTNPPNQAGGYVDGRPMCNSVSHKSAQGNYAKIDDMFFKQAYSKNYAPNAPVDFGAATSDHYFVSGQTDLCQGGC